MRKVALALLAPAIALAAPAAAQDKLKSFVPDSATTVTTSFDCKQKYLTIIWFRGYSDPDVLQAGRAAAATYGLPGALMNGDGDTNAFYIRAVDVRDMSGLLRSIKQLKNTNGMRIGYIPLEDRYSTIDEQQDAMDDSPPESIVELGGETC
ncbi:hypothetical protein [Sphingopyxis sp. KK2]|uniref:hypothetical protein n=1 Tax=Sphingopyxis sp. KK2 TaxID=1855727 RepID=UPI001181B59C|nr:hypothetical protein [Sphingopyxis sp. KK2]